MKTISSKSNTYIKFVRNLQKKKERTSSERFYIEGIRLIGEALRTGYPLESILYCPTLLVSEFGSGLVKEAGNKNFEVIEVNKDVFQSFALKEGPQGIAAIGIQKKTDLMSITSLGGVWIVLEDVQDPGNLGTILRSLDGAGGKGMILLGKSTDAYHPTAVRSSTGAIFTIPVITSIYSEIKQWKLKINAQFIGTVCQPAINFRKFNYPREMVLVMGSEQKGLSIDLTALCDGLVTIPMSGSVDSINLSNAASIVLFEIYNKSLTDD